MKKEKEYKYVTIVHSDCYRKYLNKKEKLISVSDLISGVSSVKHSEVFKYIISKSDFILLINNGKLSQNSGKVITIEVDSIEVEFNRKSSKLISAKCFSAHKHIHVRLYDVLLKNPDLSLEDKFIYTVYRAYHIHQSNLGYRNPSDRDVNVIHFVKWIKSHFGNINRINEMVVNFTKCMLFSTQRERTSHTFRVKQINDTLLAETSHILYVDYALVKNDSFNLSQFRALATEFLYARPLAKDKVTTDNYVEMTSNMSKTHAANFEKRYKNNEVGAITQQSIATMLGGCASNISKMFTSQNKVYTFDSITHSEYASLLHEKSTTGKWIDLSKFHFGTTASEDGEIYLNNSMFKGIGSKLISNMNFKSIIRGPKKQTITINGIKTKIEKVKRSKLTRLASSKKYSTEFKYCNHQSDVQLLTIQRTSHAHVYANSTNEIKSADVLKYQIVAKTKEEAIQKLTSFELKSLMQKSALKVLNFKMGKKTLAASRKTIGWQVKRANDLLNLTDDETSASLVHNLTSFINSYNNSKALYNEVDSRIAMNMKVQSKMISNSKLITINSNLVVNNSLDDCPFDLVDNSSVGYKNISCVPIGA